MSEVRRLSMEPSRAMMRAGCNGLHEELAGDLGDVKAWQSGRYFANDGSAGEP